MMDKGKNILLLSSETFDFQRRMKCAKIIMMTRLKLGTSELYEMSFIVFVALVVDIGYHEEE